MVTVGGGLVLNGGASVNSGDVSVSAGPISVMSTLATQTTLDVSTADSAFASVGILGRLASGLSGPANAMLLLEGNNVLFRVNANGQTTVGNGLSVTNGGLSITGGMTEATDAFIPAGDWGVTGGALSVSHGVAAAGPAVGSISVSVNNFNDNLIVGRLQSAVGSNANLLSLMVANSPKLLVNSNGYTTISGGAVADQVVVRGGFATTADVVTNGNIVAKGGSLSVLTTQTSGNVFTVKSTHASYTGQLITGGVAAGDVSANVLTLTSDQATPSLLFQLVGNGHLTVTSGATITAAGFSTQIADGIAIPASGMTVAGDFILSTGAKSVTTSSTSSKVLSVSATSTGTALTGRVNSAATGANALTLTDGSVVMMQVCWSVGLWLFCVHVLHVTCLLCDPHRSSQMAQQPSRVV